MKNRLVLFVLGFLIWSLLTWPIDIQHAMVGLIVAGLVTFLTGDLFASGRNAGLAIRRQNFRSPARYLWFGYYIPLFLWECLKANIDVALRVLNPALPINPAIVKVKTALRSDAGLTFLANSITLTPGTLCVDIDSQEGVLYIHWIDIKSQDADEATRLIVSKFENVLKRIFE